jgi:peptide/nickel transport system permease protein
MDFLKRRIITAIAAFIVVLNLDFIIPRLVPGSAAEIFASGTKLPAVAVKLISERLGLGQPLYVQYYLYLKGIFTNWPPYFGFSYQYYPTSVSSLIAARLPWTLLLISSSMLLSVVIGYFLAGITSLRRGGKGEFAALYSSILFWATPAFWIGMILLWVFAVWLHWLPPFGNVTVGTTTTLGYASSIVTHAILPVITLTAVVFGQNYILLRGSTQAVLKSDYVMAAQARGLKGRTVAFAYILRNSLLPVVSLLGYSIASLVSSVVLVEAVFGYAGLGDLIVDAVVNRDYPVLEGSFFYITLMVIIGAVVGDLLARRLDPRLR